MNKLDIDEVSVRMGFEKILIKQAERYNTVYPCFSDIVGVVYASYEKDMNTYFIMRKKKAGNFDYGDVGNVIFENIEKHIFSVPNEFGNEFENKKLALALWAKANQFLLYIGLSYMLRDGIINKTTQNKLIKKYRLKEFKKIHKKRYRKIVLILLLTIFIGIGGFKVYDYFEYELYHYYWSKKEMVPYEDIEKKSLLEWENISKDIETFKKNEALSKRKEDDIFSPPKINPKKEKIKNTPKGNQKESPRLVPNKNKQTSKKSVDKTQKNPYFGKHLYTGDKPYLNHFGHGVYDKELPSYVSVKNGAKTDAIVLFQDVLTGEIIRHVYIRRSQDYKIKNIPVGVYKMKVYYGNDWNPYKKHKDNFPDGGFMRNESFSAMSSSKDYVRINKEYENGGFTYSVYEITLYEVVNGNMKTEEISKSNFFEK